MSELDEPNTAPPLAEIAEGLLGLASELVEHPHTDLDRVASQLRASARHITQADPDAADFLEMHLSPELGVLFVRALESAAERPRFTAVESRTLLAKAAQIRHSLALLDACRSVLSESQTPGAF